MLKEDTNNDLLRSTVLPSVITCLFIKKSKNEIV
jgi:hypothetical protein